MLNQAALTAPTFAPNPFSALLPGADPEAKPQVCRAEGLDCESCVRASALHLVQLCGPLPVERATELYFRLYPDVACVAQARLFARLCAAAPSGC